MSSNAPTNDSEDEDKDQFYSRLQNILGKFPDKHIIILLGDFNAKIGIDDTGYKQVMRTHGLGTVNENKERFADVCNQLPGHWRWQKLVCSTAEIDEENK